MDMNTDDPGRRSSRRLFETAYTRSPYRLTVIGYPDIFNELKAGDIRDYYRNKYTSNNIFYVVVGDIDREEVVTQIREAYAKTKARSMPAMVLPEEPVQTSAREVLEEAAIELGYMHMAWHVPELRHPDVPLLDLLSAILGQGRSSRLYQEIRDKAGLVTGIDSWTYSPGSSGLFGVTAVMEAEKFEPARKAVLDEIQKLQEQPPTAQEVQKGIKQFVSAMLASRKTMQGQAQDLGANWLAANDLNFSERYLSAVKAATPLELQRVARRYLIPDNRTLFALLPNGTIPKTVAVSASSRSNSIKKFQLANGLRLLVKEDGRLPFVQFRTVFKGGLIAESLQNEGITQVTGRMLLKGTKTRSAEEIALAIESVGGHIDSYAGNNSFGVHAEVLNEDFNLGLELVSDVLLNPAFPEAALEREREIQIAAIQAQRDQLLQCAFKGMRRTLFDTRGYGLDPLGSEKSIQALRSDDLRAFHERLAVPDNCVLAVYGDVEAEAVRKAVERAFASWKPAAQVSSTGGNAGGELTRIKRFEESRDKKQAVLVLGYRGSTMLADDRYALDLLQEACSDLGSRLFLRIREELGLAYYVGAQNLLGFEPGYFAFYVGTAPESAAQVEAELLKEAELLRTEGLKEEELSRAKSKILGQRKVGRQDLAALAMTNALDELYGLGCDHSELEDALYSAVTVEQVKEVANKYLRPDAYVVSIIKP
jgi:zinc protease